MQKKKGLGKGKKNGINPKSNTKKNLKKDEGVIETDIASKSRKEIIKEYVSLRRRFLLFLGLGILIIFLLFFLTGIKVRFLLSDELNIRISPLSYSFLTLNNESIESDFTIKNENFALCNSKCSITLKDVSLDEVLHSEEAIFSHNEEKEYSFHINGTGKGSGQKIYRLSVNCNNVKTAICFTNEEVRYKNVAIINNYALEPYQEELKAKTKDEIKYIKAILTDLNQGLANLNQSLNSIPLSFSETRQIGQDILTAQIRIDIIDMELNQQISYWENEDFEMIDLLGFNPKLDAVKANITLINDSLNQTISAYSMLIGNVGSINAKDQSVLELINYYGMNSNNINDLKADDLIQLIDYINSLNITDSKDASLMFLNDEFGDSIAEIDSLIYSFDEQEFKKEYYSYLYSSILEYNGKNIGYYLLGNSSCNTLLQLYSDVILENDEGINSSLMILFNDSLLSDINDAFKKTNHYDSRFDKDIISSGLFTYDDSSNETYLRIDALPLSDIEESYCGNPRIKPISMSLHHIDIPELKDYSMNYSVSIFELDDLTSKCCVLGSCTNCINDPTSNYPILFIHGHIMNEKNSPEYSMQAFAKIQERLEQDGFLNMGELRPDDYYNLHLDDWGFVGVPVTVRSSYYYLPYTILGDYKISIEKSEKIENYALRLNENIQLLKEKTGKDKVDIIAHSMGGLVVREYIALFGSSSIDKVITINTPHQGITDKVEKYCGVLGSGIECSDMAEGSIFLAKLNAKKTYEKIYVIRSKGCNMAGKDGDGIVTFENSYLEGAKSFEIEGNCTDSLQTDLHTNVLDIDKYPKTYELIISVLDED